MHSALSTSPGNNVTSWICHNWLVACQTLVVARVCACVRAYTRARTHTHTHTHAHTHLHIHAHMRARAHKHMRGNRHVCAHTGTRISMHALVHTQDEAETHAERLERTRREALLAQQVSTTLQAPDSVGQLEWPLSSSIGPDPCSCSQCSVLICTETFCAKS